MVGALRAPTHNPKTMNLESIIFYVLLLDASAALMLAVWGGRAWWQGLSPSLSQQFPLTKGWTGLYLAIVILMGIILVRNDLLVLPFWK